MAMGMSCDEFWNQDPYLANFYRNAFIQKQRLENRNMWILGAYVRDAVSSSLSKKCKYPKEPIKFEIKTDYEVENKRRIERQKAIAQFEKFRMAWLKNGNK